MSIRFWGFPSQTAYRGFRPLTLLGISVSRSLDFSSSPLPEIWLQTTTYCAFALLLFYAVHSSLAMVTIQLLYLPHHFWASLPAYIKLTALYTWLSMPCSSLQILIVVLCFTVFFPLIFIFDFVWKTYHHHHHYHHHHSRLFQTAVHRTLKAK